MKQFVSLPPLFNAIVFATSLFFISCQEETNEVAESSGILLSTMSNYKNDGTLIEKESFKYDTNGRLIEMLNSDDYKVVIEYSATSLIMKEYDKDKLSHSSIFNLNNQGLYISSPSGLFKTTTYTYDANGYRQSMVELSDSITYTQNFTVSNGNYVTIVTESNYQPFESANVTRHGFFGKSMILKQVANKMAVSNSLKSASGDSHIKKTDFEFYPDKTNTIEYENMGIYFFGKQNKNPVKQEIETLGSLPARTVNYSYEYDAKGRISKKIYDSGDYDVFTYME